MIGNSRLLYIFLTKYTKIIFSAWAKVWAGNAPSTTSITAPGGRSGQIIDIFEITGGAGDIDNSTSMPNYNHSCLL